MTYMSPAALMFDQNKYETGLLLATGLINEVGSEQLTKYFNSPNFTYQQALDTIQHYYDISGGEIVLHGGWGIAFTVGSYRQGSNDIDFASEIDGLYRIAKIEKVNYVTDWGSFVVVYDGRMIEFSLNGIRGTSLSGGILNYERDGYKFRILDPERIAALKLRRIYSRKNDKQGVHERDIIDLFTLLSSDILFDHAGSNIATFIYENCPRLESAAELLGELDIETIFPLLSQYLSSKQIDAKLVLFQRRRDEITKRLEASILHRRYLQERGLS